MDFYIQGWICCSKVSIWASNFWTLLIVTSSFNGGVDREELGSLLVQWADLASVVSLGSNVAG